MQTLGRLNYKTKDERKKTKYFCKYHVDDGYDIESFLLSLKTTFRIGSSKSQLLTSKVELLKDANPRKWKRKKTHDPEALDTKIPAKRKSRGLLM